MNETAKGRIGETANGGMGEEKKKEVRSYQDLDVFQRAMGLVMNIFEITKRFPKEEQYSLVDQIRRSSRSICANIGEGWRKRRYRAAFISKMSDAETEASETQVWVEIACRSRYLSKSEAVKLNDDCDHIMAQLVRMIDQTDKWLIKPSPTRRFADSPDHSFGL